MVNPAAVLDFLKATSQYHGVAELARALALPEEDVAACLEVLHKQHRVTRILVAGNDQYEYAYLP
jgi:hypothetical protein